MFGVDALKRILRDILAYVRQTWPTLATSVRVVLICVLTDLRLGNNEGRRRVAAIGRPMMTSMVQRAAAAKD